MTLNSEYWNSRYLENDFGWDAGEITTPLKTYFDQLSNKSINILIPGGGNGYEAEYLFNAGFKNVFALDYAAEPLQNLKKRCPNFPSNNLLQDNFFNHNEQYDLIVEQTFFCAIDISLRSAYAKHMNELLKPGGKLVGLLFSAVLNTDGPPFGGNKEEYITFFEPHFTIETMEPCYNSIKPRENRELFISLVKR